MKKQNAGYTVVEVLIFLAVSTGLFVAVIGTFSGRQARAEFVTAARELESRMQDITNDVSTGYYNHPGNFDCSVNASGQPQPQLVAGGGSQGTNQDCIFIGRAVHFLDAANNKYDLYTVVGSRLGDDDNDSDDFEDAKPTPLITPRAVEGIRMPVGLAIDSIWSIDGVTRTPRTGVGFFTTFGVGPGASNSSLSVNVVPLGTSLTNDSATVQGAILAIDNSTPINPDGGVEICVNGNATDQYAILKLGGGSSRLTTNLTIREGSCDGAGY